MQVIFYSMKKRRNSTKQPATTGTPKTCVLKDNCSVLSPTLEIDWNNNDPSVYNYCCIPTWGRYYYITDWVFNGRLWKTICVVDSLASWKGDIKSSTLYILRSQSAYNLQLPDTTYPATTNFHRFVSTPIDCGFAGADLASGCFIMGTVARATNVVAPTGITYYVMSAGTFDLFRDAIFIDLTANMSTQLQNVPAMMLCNPVNYITSLMWLPFIPDKTNAHDLTLGYWVAPNISGVDIATSLKWEKTFTINNSRPTHDRGDWQILPPFCRYYVFVPYFGIIELPAEIAAYHSFTGVITCSIATGRATLKIIPDISGISAAPCIIHTAQIGQGLDMAGMQTDLQKFVGGVAKTLIGGAQAIAGNVSGFMNFAQGGIESAVALSSPTAQYYGSAGGTTETWTDAFAITEWYEPTDEDIAHRGRPLCERRQLATLSGFCQVSDGTIDSEATPAEKAEIKSYLEGGFFIE